MTIITLVLTFNDHLQHLVCLYGAQVIVNSTAVRGLTDIILYTQSPTGPRAKSVHVS